MTGPLLYFFGLYFFFSGLDLSCGRARFGMLGVIDPSASSGESSLELGDGPSRPADDAVRFRDSIHERSVRPGQSLVISLGMVNRTCDTWALTVRASGARTFR